MCAPITLYYSLNLWLVVSVCRGRCPEDPFPTAALFTGRCNHIPARLPSCKPTPPPPVIQPTHTQPPCHHQHDIRASFTTAGKHQICWEGERVDELHSSTKLASHLTYFTHNTQLSTSSRHGKHAGKNCNKTGREVEHGGKTKRKENRVDWKQQERDGDGDDITSNGIEKKAWIALEFSSIPSLPKKRPFSNVPVCDWGCKKMCWSKGQVICLIKYTQRCRREEHSVQRKEDGSFNSDVGWSGQSLAESHESKSKSV